MIKYFPQKRESDTGNIRGEIVEIFEEKLNLTKRIAVPLLLRLLTLILSVAVAPTEPIPPAATVAPDIAKVIPAPTDEQTRQNQHPKKMSEFW